MGRVRAHPPHLPNTGPLEARQSVELPSALRDREPLGETDHETWRTGKILPRHWPWAELSADACSKGPSRPCDGRRPRGRRSGPRRPSGARSLICVERWSAGLRPTAGPSATASSSVARTRRGAELPRPGGPRSAGMLPWSRMAHAELPPSEGATPCSRSPEPRDAAGSAGLYCQTAPVPTPNGLAAPAGPCGPTAPTVT